VDVSDLLEVAPELEHGGELETSLMLHLAPERVRRDQMADFTPSPRDIGRYVRHRMPTPPVGSSGVLGFPTIATAEKGRALFERWVKAITDLLDRRRG
jgi:creatinine amidohydrolase